MPAEDDAGSHGQGEDEIELLLCLLALYERLQLASSQFLKKVKALNYTKATYIEGLRDTGRNIVDSFHELEKVSIKHGL